MVNGTVTGAEARRETDGFGDIGPGLGRRFSQRQAPGETGRAGRRQGAARAVSVARFNPGALQHHLPVRCDQDVDDARADDLVSRMRGHFPLREIVPVAQHGLAEAIAAASGVVHATPMGMLHHPGVAFDVDLLREGAWVSDVVYRPLETELLRQAAERGHPVLDGGRMAVGQACASLHIITGMSPDRDRMQRHFRALIGAEASSGAEGDGQ